MNDHALADLRAKAQYHRERLDLYRAKVYGPRPTSPTRLRELQQLSDAASERYDVARRVVAREKAPDSTP